MYDISDIAWVLFITADGMADIDALYNMREELAAKLVGIIEEQYMGQI